MGELIMRIYVHSSPLLCGAGRSGAIELNNTAPIGAFND